MVGIRKGMYGLQQADILANIQLRYHLQKYGYTHCLFQHKTRDVFFTLVVDEFGIKYTDIKDLHHLHQSINQLCKTTIDTTNSLYCSPTIKWDYNKQYLDISMPGYLARLIAKYNLLNLSKLQHSPYRYKNLTYGFKAQFTKYPDYSKPLLPKGI